MEQSNEFYWMSLTGQDEMAAVVEWVKTNSKRSTVDISLRTTKSMEVGVDKYEPSEHGSVLTYSLVCHIHMTELWQMLVSLRNDDYDEVRDLADGIVDSLKVVCYEDRKTEAIDKYTIIFTDEPVTPDYPDTWVYAASSAYPFHPTYGFYQHGELVGDPEDFSHLGVMVDLSKLPLDVQRAVVQDLALDSIENS